MAIKRLDINQVDSGTHEKKESWPFGKLSVVP
jgi:hypothetical protein